MEEKKSRKIIKGTIDKITRIIDKINRVTVKINRVSAFSKNGSCLFKIVIIFLI